MLNNMEGDVSEGPPASAGPTGPSEEGLDLDISRRTTPGASTKASEVSESKMSKAWLGKDKRPGPGSYMHSTDFSSRHRKPPSFGFGTDTRKARLPFASPGPGAYEAAPRREPQISATPRREEKALRHKAPGPGSYELPTLLKPKISMAPRREAQKQRQGPGPGDYEAFRSHGPSFGFGTARQRARHPAELHGVTPGPGAYRNPRELPHEPR